MATPRKRHKIRDAEKTKALLMKAVSDLMKEFGYNGVKVMKISRHIGKDKNVIRYHYQGLANLQKSYIREKDYWLPFFERFRLDGDVAEDTVKSLFIELMQENFRFFWNDPEMQKIILWQISEENPLMRSISEAREVEGAKLLGKTDPYFIGSGVNFRTVIAILLGGIYYIVLHATTNKSTVCGIDANRERDRKDIIRTIEQVIDWAWQAAKESRKQ